MIDSEKNDIADFLGAQVRSLFEIDNSEQSVKITYKKMNAIENSRISENDLALALAKSQEVKAVKLT